MTQMQTHGDVRHAYEMTEDAQQIYRNYTRLHTELIPYMQKYSKIACDTGMPPVRHLVLNYMNDANVYNIEDEFLLGEYDSKTKLIKCLDLDQNDGDGELGRICDVKLNDYYRYRYLRIRIIPATK